MAIIHLDIFYVNLDVMGICVKGQFKEIFEDVKE